MQARRSCTVASLTLVKATFDARPNPVKYHVRRDAMPAMMRVAPAAGRVSYGSRAMLALGVAMLLPACSPADEEAERGNGTAPAPEASRPADAVISPTAAGAGI